MPSGIIVDERLVPCEVPVLHWADTELWFPSRVKRSVTMFVVNHWTGSENPVERVVSNMKQRSTSVHFIVDPQGQVYQCMDAQARAAHAVEGHGNSVGVGIEFINRGHSLHLPARGVEREQTVEVLHGQKVQYGLMTEAQVEAGVALNRALCSAYGLPGVLPIDARTGGIYASTLPVAYLTRFRGVLGHIHLDRGKIDPGLELLRRIGEALEGPAVA